VFWWLGSLMVLLGVVCWVDVGFGLKGFGVDVVSLKFWYFWDFLVNPGVHSIVPLVGKLKK